MRVIIVSFSSLCLLAMVGCRGSNYYLGKGNQFFDISFSVLEDPDKLGVAVRLYIPGDLRLKTFEQVDQNEIVGWLGVQPISR